MSNVLLISYLFPPAAGIGSPRALQHARYLTEYGCKVWVLTAKFATTPHNDPKLLRMVPPGVKVYGAFNPEVPYRFRDWIWKRVAPPRLATELKEEQRASRKGLLQPVKRMVSTVIQRAACPDVQVGWSWFATRKAFSIIRRHKIDAVLMNIPPYSTMKIGVAIKRRFPHVRLISDIRDDWVGYYLPLFDSASSEYKKNYAVRLERELVESSDFVSVLSPPQRQNIRERYPKEPEEKFLCTPNGYSPDSFAGFTPRPHGFDGMVVGYFGSVFGNPVYSPKLYLDAVDSLPAEIRSRIETRFIGRIAAEALPSFEGRSAPVKCLGFMSHRDGVKHLEEADYLMLIARDPTPYAGKMFDYLATGKPILALTPLDGAIAQVIRQTGAGWVIDPDDPAAVRQAMLEAYQRWTRGEHRVTPDQKIVESFSWPNLVKHLASYTGLIGR